MYLCDTTYSTHVFSANYDYCCAFLALTHSCSGIDREAVEDLFGKNFFTFDTNPKSRGSAPSTASETSSTLQQDSSTTFPNNSDYSSLDDIMNVVNALRFLCVHKWSAMGDSFLACSLAGEASHLQKSMLNTRQQNVFWNEEWLD